MKIVGFCVVGPNEANRFLKGTLDQFKALCDDVLIACNNTDPQTEEMIRAYGFKFYRDDREWGKFQPNIKTRLLNEIAKLEPTHILPLDSDEVIEGITRADLEGMAKNEGNYFFIVNLWNDGYAPELSFWNIRFYKFDPKHTSFLNKPVHCGLAPPYAYNYGVYVPFVVKHFGLKNKEDRVKKVSRYQKYDPNAIHKWRGFYDSLSSTSPGTPLDIEKLKAEVEAEVRKMGKQTKTKRETTMDKFFYVKRLKDGKIMDIPERDLNRTLATKKFELIGEAVITTSAELPVQEKEDVVEDKVISCPICGKEAKTEGGLKIHKSKAHP